MKKILVILTSLFFVGGFVKAENMMCIEVYQPVCAVKNGVIKTYSNDCFAKVNGAEILHMWACTWMEKNNMIKKLKYITGDIQKMVDKAIENYFKRLSLKTIPEQLNILQSKLKKIQQVREQLQKIWKLNELIWELLFYLEFKFEEKIAQLKSQLVWAEDSISQDLLQSVLQETSWE